MNVTLLSVTPDALNLLLRTKNARLANDSDPSTWSEEKRIEHLHYMTTTIKSSYEFVDYVFEISGVSRAFTHQLVRSRQGSYQQESQRTIDASDNGFLNLPVSIGITKESIYNDACHASFNSYSLLMDLGLPAQDARGVLPTATLTTIVAKFNLRTLHEMSKVRLCSRTQGEYQEIFRAMREAVIAVHPWVGEFRFLEVACVADGICAFPRWGRTKCKFYDAEMDQTTIKNETHTLFWSSEKQVAVPVAVDGKTQ